MPERPTVGEMDSSTVATVQQRVLYLRVPVPARPIPSQPPPRQHNMYRHAQQSATVHSQVKLQHIETINSACEAARTETIDRGERCASVCFSARPPAPVRFGALPSFPVFLSVACVAAASSAFTQLRAHAPRTARGGKVAAPPDQMHGAGPSTAPPIALYPPMQPFELRHVNSLPR